VRLTFVAHSTRKPSGGIMAIYEFANAMVRRGHEVHLVHRPNVTMRAGQATSLHDLEWARFEPLLHHHFATIEHEVQPVPDANGSGAYDMREALLTRIVGDVVDFSAFPPADFVFWYHHLLPADRGRPLMFVQGALLGKPHQRARMQRPCPKLCTARWLVDFGRAAGVDEAELVHLRYGIDHQKYRVTEPLEARPQQVSMLYHAHRSKGARFGLDAIAAVVERLPDVHFKLFGVSDPAVPLPPRTTFSTNPTQRVLVHEIYNHSRIFVQPSIREGFGFAPVEAMACGCAVVSTDNGGSRDYAFDEDTALVVPPRDSAALADAIERLVLDDDLRLILARRANAFVRETFDWNTSAAHLEEFLEAYGADPARYGAAQRSDVPR